MNDNEKIKIFYMGSDKRLSARLSCITEKSADYKQNNYPRFATSFSFIGIKKSTKCYL